MALGFASALGAGAFEVARGVVVMGYDDSAVTAGIARTETVTRRGSGAMSRMALGFATSFAVAAGAGAKMALDFQQNMTLIQSSAGGTTEDVKFLSAEVMKLSKISPYGPNELSKALFHLKSLGYDNAKAMSALRAGIRGAIAGGSNLEATVNAIGAAFQTGIKGAETFESTMRAVDAAAGAGNMRLEDLIGALSTGILPSAKTAGLSLQDVGAALAVMVDQGQNANMAATRLRMTFTLLAAPSDKAEKQLKRIGLSGDQFAATMQGPGGLLAALTLLRDHLEILPSKAEKFQLLARAFGGGRSAGAIMLLVNSLDLLGQKYGQMDRIQTNFNNNVAARSQNAAVRIRKAWSEVQVFLIQLGNLILPTLTKFASGLGAIANFLSRHQSLVHGLTQAIMGLIAVYALVRTQAFLAAAGERLYAFWTGRAAVMSRLAGTAGYQAAAGQAAAGASASAAGGAAMVATGRFAALRGILGGLARAWVIPVLIAVTVHAIMDSSWGFLRDKIPGFKSLDDWIGNNAGGNWVNRQLGKIGLGGFDTSPKKGKLTGTKGGTDKSLSQQAHDRHNDRWAALYEKQRIARLRRLRAQHRNQINSARQFKTPYGIQLQQARASQTADEHDDLAALKAEQRFLTQTLNKKGLTRKQILDLNQRLGTVNSQIYGIEQGFASARNAAKRKHNAAMDRARREADKLKLPNKYSLAIQKAASTSETDDDLKAYKAEEQWLLGQIKSKKNTEKRLTALYKELASVRKHIKNLRKKDQDDESAAMKELIAFMNHRQNTFFGDFSSSVFGVDSKGKLLPGTQTGKPKTTEQPPKIVTIHQHFGKGAESHMENFRQATFAAEHST